MLIPIFKWMIRILVGLFLMLVLLVIIVVVGYDIDTRTNGSIMSSGVERKFQYYIPDTYDPGNPVPLVLSIHGFSSWPRNQMYISQWNTLADRYGFIVVYPSGTGLPKRWRSPVSYDNKSGTSEDVIFLSALIDHMQQEYNIDPQRIYVNGLSNGAGMSVILGCELSGRVAAVGGVAGAYLYPFAACHTSRPVPMISFHGTADPIVPFTGGSSHYFNVPFPDIPEWITQRAAFNGCSPTPRVVLDQETVTGIEYLQCSGDASVTFYTIYGGGHTWPGGRPLPEWIAGYTSDALSASELMWEFFQQHPLPGSEIQKP